MPTVPGEANPYLRLVSDDAPAPAAAPANPYLMQLQQDKSRQDKSLAAALQPAAATDPDKYAQTRLLAKDAGMPMGVVETDPDAVARDLRMRRVTEAVSKSPMLQAWMAQDDNAILAMDDYESLSGLESALRSTKNLLISPFRGFDISMGQGIAGLGRLNDAAARKFNDSVRAVGLDSVADVLDTPIPWWSNPSNWARSAGQAIEKSAGPALPDDQQNFATDVGEGLGSLVGQIIASRVNPAAGVTLMAGQGAESAGDRAEEAGATVDQADNAAMLGSVVTAATEKIGLDKLLDRLPPKVKNDAARWITDKLVAGGIEGAQEGVEQIANNVIARSLYEPDSPIFAGVMDNASVGGAVGFIARSVLGIKMRGQEADEVRSEQTTLDALVQATAGSKLAARAPDKFEEFIKRAAGAENVYVPAEAAQRLFQSMPPNEVASQIGVSSETYMEAILTGGDVAIPIESYLTRVAPQFHDQLRDVARFTPGAMTPEESAQNEEQAVDSAERFMASAQSQTPSDQRVLDDVSGMLLSTGRYRRQDVEKYAQVMQAAFRTLAARQGADAFDLYSRYRLRIKSELPAALQKLDIDTVIDPLLDRLRTGARAPDKRQTLSDFIAATGGVTDQVFTGEIATLNESDRAVRKGKPRLIRDDAARTLDRAREAAAEAGYLSPDSDVNDLLNLLDQEMSGRPVYSQAQQSTPGVELNRNLDELDNELSRRGLDVNKATNQQIKAALFGESGRDVPDDLVSVFDQAAYHGTHAKGIDKFSLNKIGTGEGQQAFGWGLYFASSKDIAEYYRRTISGISKIPGSREAEAALEKAAGDRAEAIRMLKRKGDEAALEFLKRDPNRGQTYQVEVPEDADLLDYDALMYDQPVAVLEAIGDSEVLRKVLSNAGPFVYDNRIGKAVMEEPAGKDFYEALEKETGSPEAASAALREAGVLGLKFLDGASRGQKPGEKSHNYVIWDESAVEITRTLYQSALSGTFDAGDPNILNQQDTESAIRRGYIQFGGDRQFTIAILEKADATTFLHETGHFFLEVLGDLAADPDAPADIVADYAAALKFLGVESREQIGTEQHEMWARGFERYLGEGKAPSAELAPAFARFKAWVKAIYKTLRNLNVELTDDVRGVFDRLLATDQEITQAENSMDYAGIFNDANAAGWTDAEFAARLKLNDDAREESEVKLMARAMRDVTRETKAWWKERSEDVQKEVTAEVHAMPVYRALSLLQSGTTPDGTEIEGSGQKLDKGWLERQYGQEWLNKNLLRKRVYSVTGGADPDVIALGVGFSSGDEMVNALANVQPMAAVIAAQTKARMIDQYGDIMTDGTMPEQAMRAVHGSKRFKALEADLRALERLAGEARPAAAGLRRTAELIVGQKKVRDLQPNTYLRAERKAAKEAIAAAGKGDVGLALEAQRRRLLNAHLFDVASKAQDETDRLRRYIRKFEKPALRVRLGKINRLEQVEALLSQYDMRQVSGKKIDEGKARTELLGLIDSGQIIAPPGLIRSLRAGDRTNWRELTVEDLRGIRDILRQTEAAAKSEYEALVNGERVQLDDIAEKIAADTLAGGKPVMPIYGDLSPDETVKRYGKQALSMWLRPSALARLLDGGKDNGAWTRNVIQPIRRAVVEQLEPMKRKAQEDLADLYSRHYTVKEMSAMNERRSVPGMPGPVTRWDLISLGLNSGNADNRKAILESEVAGQRPYAEQGVQQALRQLDAKDWAFIQDTWTYIDSYWPAIKESQKRRKGIAPPKVEVLPFTITTRDGQTIDVSGGYYPLKYNARLDSKARQNEMDEAFERMRSGTLSAVQSKYGHTQERVGSGKQPVMLSMNVLHGHINNVIMDLALGDVVNYADRVLTRTQVRQSLIDTGNLDTLETWKLWLKDTATGEIGARTGVEQMAQFVRFGFTKSKLGFNAMTVALQLTGLAQTIPVVGSTHAAAAALDLAGRPRAAIRQVMAESPFMRARYELNTFNKDISSIQEALRSGAPIGKGSGFVGGFINAVRAVQLPPQLVSWAFFGIRQTQLVVDTTTWMAGYRKGSGQGMPHAEAVLYADGIVENAQTSGMFSDRSAIERGTFSDNTRQSEFVKLWTTLGSYMIAKGNITFESYKRTDFRSPSSILAFGSDVMLLFAAEAVLMAALKGGWPEEDEDWWWWTTKTVASQAAGTIPVVREIPSFYAGYGAAGGPIGSTAKDVATAMQQTSQGEVDPQLIKSYTNLIGTATGYPSVQFNRAFTAFWAENVEGQDVPAYEYVSGPRR